MITPFNRRAFLKGLGLGAAVLPVLEIERGNAACLANAPKRVILVTWPNGCLTSGENVTWATGGETDFVLPGFMSSLTPHRADLILMDGIDYSFILDQPNPLNGDVGGHGVVQGMLTGKFLKVLTNPEGNVAGGPSIDQYLGNAMKAKGFPGVPSLCLGVFNHSGVSASWRGAGDPVLPDQDPYHVFASLFAGGGGAATPDVQRTAKARASILDYVARDLGRLSARVGTDDKLKIEGHLQSVRDIEAQLARGSTPLDSACKPAPPAPGIDPLSTVYFAETLKMQMDLIVAALAADLTRVVELQIADPYGSNVVFTNLGIANTAEITEFGPKNCWHEIAHEDQPTKIKIDTFFQQQFSYLIGSLKAQMEGSQRMLDNTAVVLLNNMRTGDHEVRGVPVVVAGSCGGYFKTGRSLKLTGVANNRLLVSLANAMDVPTATFGESMYGGELPQLRG